MFCVFAILGLVWASLWRAWFHDRPGDQPGISAAELAEIGAASPQTHAGGVWSGLFHSRQTWLLMAMYWCYVWGSWFYFSWFPTFLVRGAGFTEKQMGLLSALPFLLGCGGNLAGGVLSDRLAVRYGLKVARCGQASASLAVSSLLILGLAFAKDKTLVMILSPLGFGVLDLMLPAAWSLCLDLGRAHAGVLTATMNTAGLAGGFMCTVLFGYLVRATGGYHTPLCVVAAMVMLSAILFALIDPRRPVWKEAEV
jgi:predicted MFS family arabinose efflux permease